MIGKRGMTLLDLMIGMIITGVVLTAAIAVVVRHRRLYTNMEDTTEAMGALNHLEAVLGAELLPINPSAGDLIAATRDSMVTRSFVGVYSVCSKTLSPVAFTISRVSEIGVPSEADSAVVYSLGPTSDIADDLWEPIALSSMSSATCPNGDAGWAFSVTGLSYDEASQVPPGAPLRAFIHTSYSFVQRDDDWYVVRNDRGGERYTISGPFLPPADEGAGLRFVYVDADGNSTYVESEVARVDIVASAARAVSGSKGDPVPLSRTFSFTFRNN